ncbi:hypothetical protein HD806DRAFT_478652 [Xylariaceae sp. AK1471]|nr:hypothetical protein HD806DRAFT_478652 [Xylariaceae sp. AK1471]
MMGLFGRGRNRSQSVDSATPWQSLHDEDEEAPLLPGSDHVYLTRTKDGKPAFGRKKPDKLLQDFGFDILGQSLGIPSRKDFERQGRPLSMRSQSSGLITAPATPQQSREARRLDDGNQVYTHEDTTESPAISRKTSSIRSCSTPAPNAMARYNHHNVSNPHQHATYRASRPFLIPQAFNLPPPPPPPPAAVNWHNRPMMNSMMNSGRPPISMSYQGAAYQSTHLPSYLYHGATNFQGAPNWANTQHHMAGQYPNPLGISLPQTTATTILPYYQQFIQPQPPYLPQIQAMPAARPVNIPPPPPPPPPPQQDWLQSYAMATGRSKGSTQNTNWASNPGNAVKQASQVRNSSGSTRPTQDRGKDDTDVKKLSKRIRHVHVCVGCGKKRSRGYHRDNPLKRGEIPKLDYCRKCVEDAEYTDPETSNAGVTDDASFKKYPKGAPIPSFSTDEGRAVVNGEYVYEQSRRGGRWIKKSKRRGIFSRLFSRRAGSNAFPLPPRSISTAEESRSRASSPVSDLFPVRSLRKAPKSSVRLSDEKANSSNIQVEAETPVLPQQRSAHAESWNAEHNSPLVPRNTESEEAESEVKVLTSSQNGPTLAQYRTYRPRSQPQPQSRPVVVDHSPPGDTSNSLPVFHEKRSSPRLENKSVAEAAPVSQPVGTEARSKTSNQTFSTEPSAAVMQAHNQSGASERVKKSRESSSENVSPINASGETQDRDVTASGNKPPEIRVTVAPEVAVEESPNKPTDHFDTGFGSNEPQTSFDHNPQINRELMTESHPLLSYEKCERPPSGDDLPELVHETKAKIHWEEPLTPTDMPYADGSHSPHVMSDQLSDMQTDMDRDVEEMAERDLAAAGKLFDSFSSTLGGSTTSTFPTASFVTRSNMSIVSYDSDSDAEGTESRGTARAAEAKQIEFSSEIDQHQKSATLHSPTDLIAHPEHSSGGSKPEPPHPRKNNLYNQIHDGQDDDNDVDFFPSPVGSSLVGHTGHSADDLVIRSTRAQDNSATITSGHRRRRLKRLPPTT